MKSVELNALIDHTCLKATARADDIRTLCREAKRYGFASVCINPSFVPLAAKCLKGSKVAVCTVIGFPLGQNTTLVKGFEAYEAIMNGARELDFVVNQRLLKATAVGDEKACVALERELKICAGKLLTKEDDERLGHPKIVTKLILECCNLTREEIVLGCRLAKAAGFDFVKTSTGFGSGGATVEDVRLMRKTVGRKMGVKAAGGIRDRATALAMVAAGATRIGTSAGVAIVTEKSSVKL